MKKERDFVSDLTNMCMTDLLILGRHFSQMRLILLSRDMVTHKTTCIGVVILFKTAQLQT
jgi:hypothetical protein